MPLSSASPLDRTVPQCLFVAPLTPQSLLQLINYWKRSCGKPGSIITRLQSSGPSIKLSQIKLSALSPRRSATCYGTTGCTLSTLHQRALQLPTEALKVHTV